MTCLLDTHILIWWLYDDPKLPKRHRNLIMDPTNAIVVSVASFWEIEIKSALGHLVIDPAYPEAVKEEGFDILSIKSSHALALRDLSNYHKDPFDRMLIAQAVSEDLILLSVDRHIARYGGLVKLL